MYRTTASVAILVSLLASILQAQPANPATPPPMTVRLVPLQHADAAETQHALQEINFPIAVSAIGGNRLLLRGQDGDIAVVLEKIIPALDVPQSGSDAALQTHLIQLRNMPSNKLMEMLSTATAGTRARLALDPANRVVVVKAPASEVAVVRSVLEQLDQASPSLTLHFFFLGGTLGVTSDHENAGHWPAGLSAVAKALQESGMQDLELIAPFVVRTDVNADYLARGAMDSERLELTVRGTSRVLADGKTVQLQVDAFLKGGLGEEGKVSGAGHFAFNGTITTKLGDYVVVSAAPGSTTRGDAVALAVRVTAD